MDHVSSHATVVAAPNGTPAQRWQSVTDIRPYFVMIQYSDAKTGLSGLFALLDSGEVQWAADHVPASEFGAGLLQSMAASITYVDL